MDYTIAERSGFHLITETRTGRTKVTVAVSLPNVWAFVEIAEFDDYEDAVLTVFAFEEQGRKPSDFVEGVKDDSTPDPEGDSPEEDDDTSASEAVLTGTVVD